MNRCGFRFVAALLGSLVIIGGPASAGVIPKDVADLTREAKKIVIGDVVQVTSYWTADHTMIKSRVVVRVDDYLKGAGALAPRSEPAAPRRPYEVTTAPEGPARLEILELEGGTVGDVTLTVTVLPTFETGDRVLLFLDDHETRLVGCFQGAYLTDGNQAVKLRPGCARNSPDGYMLLADVLKDISVALPPEQAGNAAIDAVTPYGGGFSLPLPAPRYGLCGYDWSYNANPMGESYVVNGNCSDASAGSSAAQIAEIQKAAAAWNGAGADFSFNYGGATGSASVTFDGVNLVYFSNNPPSGGGYVAATFIWASGGNISECDLVFNDLDYTWWNGSGNCGGNKMDIWNVCTHEFGHFLCLADLYGGGDSAKTMYGYVGYCDTYARTLHSDDINGIIAIYGAGGASCGDGTCDAGEDQCSCPSDCGTPPGTETNCTDGVDNDCDNNTDCADADCSADPACGPPVEGYILSRNPDYSTDDRAYFDNETIYMQVWTNQVDFNDINKAEWELRDAAGNKVKQPLTNHFDGFYSASFALSGLPSSATDWTWKARVEDNAGTRYQPTDAITVQPAPQCTSDPQCDDGVFCNGAETCDAQNTCQAGTYACAAGEWCDEASTQCYPHGNGDFDIDADVDLEDFTGFQRCFGQTGMGYCAAGNMIGTDGMIDQDDYAEFAQGLTGP